MQIVIHDVCVSAVHGALKHEVGKTEHAGTGAEVFPQRNQASILSALVARRLVREQAGLGMAKAIDALLDVAHAEQDIPPGYGGQYGFLHV